MSESSISLTVRFPAPDAAEKTADILNAAREAIDKAYDEGKEMFLHDFLKREDLSKGIAFDSWWIPTKVSVKERYWLVVELIGSPSGTEEQDFITWLKQLGANGFDGKMVLDGGGDVEIVDLGLAEKPPVIDETSLHQRDGAGHTPLHLAAEAGNAKKVQALIDAGADIEARNRAERTPIFMAVNSDISTAKAIECIQILLSAGADINATGASGHTPLGWARRVMLIRVAAFLEQQGGK